MPEAKLPLRVLAVGNSHLAAIMRGYREMGQAAGAGISLEFLMLKEGVLPDAEDALDPELQAALHRVAPAAIFSSIGGNAHNVLGLLVHPRPFDFVLPERSGLPLDEAAETLPFGLVADTLKKRLQRAVFAPLRALREKFGGPIVHLEPPPPIPSADHILASPGRRFTRELMDEHGIAPALLRYKLWRTHSGLLKDFCAKAGIGFIPVPPQTQDSAGMLAREAWGNDPTHGNAWFGAQMLQEALPRVAGVV